MDIAENNTFEHARRTAYIALQVGRNLGVSGDQLTDIYSAALLHDIGLINAIAEAATHCSTHGLLYEHCAKGSEIVQSLPLSPKVGEYIFWHHANWDGSGEFDRQGDEIPLGSQIVYLADQLDTQLKAMQNIYADRHNIVEFARDRQGKLFSPSVVEAFIQAQEKEIFWLEYSRSRMEDVLPRVAPDSSLQVDTAGLEQIAETFAMVIDNKSPFTHTHSRGLAELLVPLSKEYGFDEETSRLLVVSGLLHDLGKLGVPNEILDKPGKLDFTEFQLIKAHSYYTKQILSRVKGFSELAEWAGNHHETLDGTGYPEGLTGKQLSLQARMVAVCDVYQALTETRPYREDMPRSKALEIMDGMVSRGKLCPEVYGDLKKVLG
ncbi:MAG TPA: HD domain-containing phosphohydrolase [Bacillota bacterium]|nr:HD domain-containing phosphohydrolase [Bacillota bacterium]